MGRLFLNLVARFDDQRKSFTGDDADATAGLDGLFAASAPQFTGHLGRTGSMDGGLGLPGHADQVLQVLQGLGTNGQPAIADDDPQEAAAQQRATACVKDAQTLERSEQDVINVLEMVLNEYPVDRGSMFLMGHSMGSGGVWYLGAKYAEYWKAIAPMSGPFVEESTYPWDRIRKK